MATIGLAHRQHRDFVAEWDEPEPALDVERALVDAVGRSLLAAGIDRAGRQARSLSEVMPRDDAAAEAWLVGEPTF